MDSVLASHPAAPGSILGLGLEIYRQRCCLDVGSRGLIMSNHLVLAGGKLVQQKMTSWEDENEAISLDIIEIEF